MPNIIKTRTTTKKFQGYTITNISDTLYNQKSPVHRKVWFSNMDGKTDRHHILRGRKNMKIKEIPKLNKRFGYFDDGKMISFPLKKKKRKCFYHTLFPSSQRF